MLRMSMVTVGVLCLVSACGGAQAGAGDGHRIVVEDATLVIVDDGGSAQVEIPFELDSDRLKPSAQAPLDALAEFVRARDDLALIEVQGHSDERGDPDYNMALSTRRAESVIDYLVDRGVERERLRARGFGATRPAVQGADERAWRQNRRVEFVVVDS